LKPQVSKPDFRTATKAIFQAAWPWDRERRREHLEALAGYGACAAQRLQNGQLRVATAAPAMQAWRAEISTG
jgi:uncharacterized protein (DUF1684 family)